MCITDLGKWCSSLSGMPSAIYNQCNALKKCLYCCIPCSIALGRVALLLITMLSCTRKKWNRSLFSAAKPKIAGATLGRWFPVCSDGRTGYWAHCFPDPNFSWRSPSKVFFALKWTYIFSFCCKVPPPGTHGSMVSSWKVIIRKC